MQFPLKCDCLFLFPGFGVDLQAGIFFKLHQNTLPLPDQFKLQITDGCQHDRGQRNGDPAGENSHAQNQGYHESPANHDRLTITPFRRQESLRQQRLELLTRWFPKRFLHQKADIIFRFIAEFAHIRQCLFHRFMLLMLRLPALQLRILAIVSFAGVFLDQSAAQRILLFLSLSGR